MELFAERIRTRLRGAAMDWEPNAFTGASIAEKSEQNFI